MDTKQTAVSLDRTELMTLIELFRLAQARMTTAEQLFYNQLFGRFDDELKTQEADQLNQMRRLEEAMMQPPPGDLPHLGPAVPFPGDVPTHVPGDANPSDQPAYGDGH